MTELLFSAVNLTRPGLELAQRAYHDGDNRTACDELAAYYAGANTPGWLRNSGPTRGPTRGPSGARVGGAVDAVVWNDTTSTSCTARSARCPGTKTAGLTGAWKEPFGQGSTTVRMSSFGSPHVRPMSPRGAHVCTW